MLDPIGRVIDEDSFSGSHTRIDVRKVTDGDYYLKIFARAAPKALVEVSMAPMTLFPVVIDKPTLPRKLAPSSVELALLEVNPGDFIRIESVSEARGVWFSVEEVEARHFPKFVSQIFDHRRKKGWATCLAKEKGVIAIVVSQQSNQPTEYQLSVPNPTQCSH